MNNQLKPVFKRLKGILKPYEPSLILKFDREDMYYVDTPYVMKYNKQNLLFGSVVLDQHEVKFYLNPVILFPELLEDVSDALKAKKVNTPYFSFTTIDEDLLAELEDLTQKGIEKFQREGAIRIIFRSS